MVQLSKKAGLGSLSLLLFILGVLFCWSFKDRCYGDIILNYLGFMAWSNGNNGFHVTILYSLFFFLPSFFVGYKFNNHWGAVSGKKLSFAACVIIFAIILMVIISALIVSYR